MSLSRIPNPAHSKALLGWYLNYRNRTTWNYTDIDPKHLPESPDKPAHKIDVCHKLLRLTPPVNIVDDWVVFLYRVAEYERVERDIVKKSLESWSGWVASFFKDIPLLMMTLQAVRSLAISQLKDNEQFIRIKDKLRKNLDAIPGPSAIEKKSEHGKEKARQTESKRKAIQDQIDALEIEKDFHHDYFDKIIKDRDAPEVDALKEQSLEDFLANYINGLRKFADSNKMLEGAEAGLPAAVAEKGQLKQAISQPVQLAAVPTTTAAPVPMAPSAKKEEKSPEAVKATTAPAAPVTATVVPEVKKVTPTPAAPVTATVVPEVKKVTPTPPVPVTATVAAEVKKEEKSPANNKVTAAPAARITATVVAEVKKEEKSPPAIIVTAPAAPAPLTISPAAKKEEKSPEPPRPTYAAIIKAPEVIKKDITPQAKPEVKNPAPKTTRVPSAVGYYPYSDLRANSIYVPMLAFPDEHRVLRSETRKKKPDKDAEKKPENPYSRYYS